MKWGLGIEHEMKLKFEYPLTQISDDIKKKIFGKISSNQTHVMISSLMVLFYFYIIESNIERPFIIDHPYEKIYNIKKNIYEHAKLKKKFPFDNSDYYSLKKEDFIRNISYFEYYLFIYSLYHYPFLLLPLSVKLLNEPSTVDIDIQLFFPYSLYIYEQNHLLLETEIEYFYDGSIQKKYIDYIEKIFLLNKKYYYKIDYHSNYNKNPIIYPKICLYETYDLNISFFNINIFNGIIHRIQNEYLSLLKYKIKIPMDNRILKVLSDLYYYKIPNLDSSLELYGVIEFQTIEYDTQNYEKIIDSFIEHEDVFFYILNYIPVFKELTSIFGKITFHKFGSIENSYEIQYISSSLPIQFEKISQDYTGSYHIWITCPYDKHTTPREFSEIHATLGNRLQLLEPIFSSHFTSPSSYALGRSDKYAKSSFRHFMSNTINYGTSDVSLIQGGKLFTIDKYYESEMDVLHEKPKIVNVYDKVYDKNGNMILNYTKLDERVITSNLYKNIQPGNKESYSVPKIMNYYEQLMNNNKNYANIIELGADIRTKGLQNQFYPIEPNESNVLILKNGFFYAYVYNPEMKTVKPYEIPLTHKTINKTMNNTKECIGIEFRIFDHFPTHYLNQIISILSRIALDTIYEYKRITKKDMYIHKQLWHNDMYQSITSGYEYIIPLHYIKWIEKEFKITILSPNAQNKTKKNMKNMKNMKDMYNTTYILQILNDKLTKKLKSAKSRTLYYKMVYTPNVKFININKMAWFEIIRTFFSKESFVYKKMKLIKKENEILSILGNEYKENIKKIKNYLNINDN